MSTLVEVGVGAPHPCMITIVVHGSVLRFPHGDLLAWEFALREARRQVLIQLPNIDWHEVDSQLAMTP
jgi:hypothetical protein